MMEDGGWGGGGWQLFVSAGCRYWGFLAREKRGFVHFYGFSCTHHSIVQLDCVWKQDKTEIDWQHTNVAGRKTVCFSAREAIDGM